MVKLLKIIEVIFGALVIGYIIYLRLFRFGDIREIHEHLWDHNFGRFMFYVLLFFLALIGIIVSILTLMGKKSKYNFEFLHKFSNFYGKSIESFMIFLSYIFPAHSGQKFLCNMGLFLWKTCEKHPRFLFFLILGVFWMPRLVIISAIFSDVFVMGKFHYIYNFSFVLLLPLIVSGIIGVLKLYCEENCKILDTIFTITDLETNYKFNTKNYMQYYYHFEICDEYDYRIKCLGYAFTEEYIREQERMEKKLGLKWNKKTTMDIYINAYDDLIDIYLFLMVYQENKDKYMTYAPITMYLFYSIVWGYLIFLTF